MEFKCPKCGSLIYSRRHVLCGVCGERIPSELLFTPEQQAAVEREMKEIKKRERESKNTPNEPTGGDVLDGSFGDFT